MRCFLIIFILLTLFSCGQRTKSISTFAPVNDSAIYEFVGFILSDKDSDYGSFSEPIVENLSVLELGEDDSLLFTQLDSLFAKSDFEFIHKQMSETNSFKLNPKFLPGYDIIPLDTIEKRKAAYFLLSKPVFSIDRTIAIININYYCFGTCGHGGTDIYKKQDGRWKTISGLSSWIN